MFLLLPLWGEYPDGERQAEDWVQDQQSRRPGGMEESSEQAGHINAAVMFIRLALGRLVEGAKAWSPYLNCYS